MNEFYVICDNIRSLENIGSIFRTADALGVNKIFLCGISGSPPHQNFSKNLVWGQAVLHPKISKTALGAEKTIPFEYYKQTWRLIDKLRRPSFAKASERRSKVFIVALENNMGKDKKSIIYTKFKPKFPLALIIGNEVRGISKKTLNKADQIIYLPMHGKKESLNVAVAFGIAGYHIMKF